MVLNGIKVPYAHQYGTGGGIICKSMKSWKTARFLQYRLWYWIIGSYSCYKTSPHKDFLRGGHLRRSGAHSLKALQRPSEVLSRCCCWGAEILMGTAVWGGAGGLRSGGAVRVLSGCLGVWEAFLDWKVDY